MSLPHFNPDADETLETVDAATGVVDYVIVENTDASDTVYLQLFASSGDTVGTDTPLQSLPCAPGVSGFFFGDSGHGGLRLGDSGVHYAVTAGPESAVAPPSTVRVNLGAH